MLLTILPGSRSSSRGVGRDKTLFPLHSCAPSGSEYMATSIFTLPNLSDSEFNCYTGVFVLNRLFFSILQGCKRVLSDSELQNWVARLQLKLPETLQVICE